MKNPLLFCFLFLGSMLFGQIKFHHVFSDNGYDFGQGIVQLDDSSYYVTGSSSSFMDGPAQLFLMKLNKFGQHQWAKHYGGSESDWGRRVFYKEDYGVLVAGYTNSSGNGAYDFYLIKTDPSGTLEWERTYGQASWEKLNDAYMTRDTGLIMVGESLESGIGTSALAICVDKNGDQQWSLSLPTNGNDRFSAIFPLNDSLFVLAGERYEPISGFNKGYFRLIHEDGSLIWEQYTGPDNTEYGINGIDVVNNEISFVGFRINPVNGQKEEYKGRLTALGAVDYELSLTSVDSRNFQFIKAYANNSSVYMTYQIQDGWGVEGAFDVYTAKFAYSLLYWESAFMSVTYPDNDEAGQLIRTNDDGAAFVGFTSGYGNGGGNVFVTKIAANDDFPTVTPQPNVFSLVSVSTNEINGDFKIYPNPAKGSFYVQISDNSSLLAYQLMDATGKVVLSGELDYSKEISISAMKSGSYLLKIYGSDGGSAFKRVFILE
jgi:hypothetical protein